MAEITNFEWLNDGSGPLTKITLSDQNGYYNFKENPLVLTQSMLDNGLWFRGTLNLADSLGLFEGEVTDRQSYLWESGNYTEYTNYVNFFDVVTDNNGVTLRNYIIDNELDLNSGRYSLDYINSNYVLIRDGELYYYVSNSNNNIVKVEVSLDGGQTFGTLWKASSSLNISYETSVSNSMTEAALPGYGGYIILNTDYLPDGVTITAPNIPMEVEWAYNGHFEANTFVIGINYTGDSFTQDFNVTSIADGASTTISVNLPLTFSGYIARFTHGTITADADKGSSPDIYGCVNLRDYLDIEDGYSYYSGSITNISDYGHYGYGDLYANLYSGEYNFNCEITVEDSTGSATTVNRSITVIMNNSSDKHIRIEVTPVSDYITLEPIADGNTYSEWTPLASFTSTPGFSEWGVSSPGYYFGYQLVSGYWANDSQMTFNDIPESIIVALDDEHYSRPAIQYSNELFNDYPYGATLVLDIGVSPHCTDDYTYESNTVRITVTALPSSEDPSTYYLVPDDLTYESGRYKYEYTPTDEEIGRDFGLSLPYTLYKNGAYLTSGTSTIYSDAYPVGGYHGHIFTNNYSYPDCYIAVNYNGMVIKSERIEVTVAGKDTKKYLSIRDPIASISTNHATGTYDVVVKFEVYDPNSSDSTYPSEMERTYNLPFGESSYEVNLSYTDYYYDVEYEIIYENDPYRIYV